MRPIEPLTHQQAQTTEPTDPMPIKTRKLFGTIALLIFIIVYVLLAMSVAIVLQVRGVGPLGELAYYVLAGLIWVLPAGLIVQWMAKIPPVTGTDART